MLMKVYKLHRISAIILWVKKMTRQEAIEYLNTYLTEPIDGRSLYRLFTTAKVPYPSLNDANERDFSETILRKVLISIPEATRLPSPQVIVISVDSPLTGAVEANLQAYDEKLNRYIGKRVYTIVSGLQKLSRLSPKYRGIIKVVSECPVAKTAGGIAPGGLTGLSLSLTIRKAALEIKTELNKRNVIKLFSELSVWLDKVIAQVQSIK